MFKKKSKKECVENDTNIEMFRVNVSSKNEPRGNIFTFFIGLAVFCIGIYMVFQNTEIHTSFTLPRIFGYSPSGGFVLFPLLIGIIILFFNGDSIWGWFLVIVGLLLIVTGIIMGLRIVFNRISLFAGIFLFGTVAAGIGLILKGLYGKNKN